MSSPNILLAGATVVAGEEVLDPGWLEIRGRRLAAVAAGPPPRPADVDLSGHVVVPGFVDAHVHGGGGSSYTSADPDAAAQVAALHLRHGTTSSMASLVTADLDPLERQVSVLADLVDDGVIAGIHLEGPWLSARYRGAHDASRLRPPDAASVRRLLTAGRGAVRMVTIAPELDGGLAAIRQIVGAGAVAAVGHTGASYERTVAAIHAGATVASHLFNAMRPMHHRYPGPVAALLEDPRVRVELVPDGVHLHPATLRLATRTVGAGRTMLVTDAVAGAGAADGDYRLGDVVVRVASGVARTHPGGAIAGSTLTMDAAFRNAVHDVGMSLADAAAATSATPAQALGLPGVGQLRPGARADLVVLDRALRVVRVMKAGAWLPM